MKRFLTRLYLTIVMLIGGIASANAVTITSAGDPLLSGATTITFDEFSIGTFDPTIAGVAFSGLSAPVEIANNQCPLVCLPINGPVLRNQTSGVEGTSILIDFSQDVSAFGFEVAAINTATTVSAFDSSNNLLGTASFGSSCCEFIYQGLGELTSSISHLVLNTSDFIQLDNFSFVSAIDTPTVPIPAALPLFGTGLAALGFLSWRRRRKAS